MIPTIEQFVSNVVDKYIVRPTGSPNMIGVGGFLFDILEHEEVSLDAEITDHYTEDNSAVQDHVALRPVMFTLRGYVAEMRDLQSNSLMPALTSIQSLASIGGFMPSFANQATQVYTKITDVTSKLNAVINQANNVFDIFSDNSTTATNQQAAYKFFKDLQQSRQLCTVETPFEIFDNMFISSIRASQKDSKTQSDFSVTFKQIRKVKTSTSSPIGGSIKDFASNYDLGHLGAPVSTGRGADEMSEAINSGQVTGKIVAPEIMNKAYSGFSL